MQRLRLVVVGLLWAVVVVMLLLRVTGGTDDAGPVATSAPHPVIEVTPHDASPTPLATGGSSNSEGVKTGSDQRTNESPANGAIVQCTLSNFARQFNIGARIVRLCDAGTCRPRNSTAPWRPPFCDDAATAAAKPPRFDFSRRPAPRAASGVFDASARLTAVFSAMGGRFRGPGGQSYVQQALRQWRDFHPAAESDVYVIADRALIAGPTADAEFVALAQTLDVRLVEKESLVTPKWQQYLDNFYIQGFMHPGGDRKTGHGQFNQLVSERFFAVEALMLKLALRHVVHLENDNMVYADLRPFVAAASRCFALASTAPHIKGFIPGVLYIRDAAALGRLTAFIADLLRCGENFGRSLTVRRKDYANDMTYTMNFYQLYGSAAFGELPAWEHRDGENCIVEALREPNESGGGDGEKDSEPPLHTALFDAASFGQWYSFSPSVDGQKPPPLHVVQGIRGRFLDAAPPPLIAWRADAQGRRRPYWKGRALLTLHVHAKNLERFRSRAD